MQNAVLMRQAIKIWGILDVLAEGMGLASNLICLKKMIYLGLML